MRARPCAPRASGSSVSVRSTVRGPGVQAATNRLAAGRAQPAGACVCPACARTASWISEAARQIRERVAGGFGAAAPRGAGHCRGRHSSQLRAACGRGHRRFTHAGWPEDRGARASLPGRRVHGSTKLGQAGCPGPWQSASVNAGRVQAGASAGGAEKTADGYGHFRVVRSRACAVGCLSRRRLKIVHQRPVSVRALVRTRLLDRKHLQSGRRAGRRAARSRPPMVGARAMSCNVERSRAGQCSRQLP